MLGKKDRARVVPNGNFIGSRERRFFTNIDHFAFTGGDIFLLGHRFLFSLWGWVSHAMDGELATVTFAGKDIGRRRPKDHLF